MKRETFVSFLVFTVLFMPALCGAVSVEKVAHEMITPSYVGGNSAVTSRISADGNYIVFQTYDHDFVRSVSPESPCTSDSRCGQGTVLGYDRKEKTYEVLSKNNEGEISGSSVEPNISNDGRFIVYQTNAGNLDRPYRDTNWIRDVYIYDRLLGKTENISVNSSQELAETWGYYEGAISTQPTVSDDGRFVAFLSNAKNFPNAVGRNFLNLYLRDRVDKTTEIVNVGWDGAPANAGVGYPEISPDGNLVVFKSSATNLVEGESLGGVFVHDLTLGETKRLEVDANYYAHPELSPDGKFIVYKANYSGICVYEIATDSYEIINVPMNYRAIASNEGRFIVFDSKAPLVDEDLNGSLSDVYVHDRTNNTIKLVSVSSDDSPGNDDSFAPQISGDGRIIVFSSRATNLVPDDFTGRIDAFARDMAIDQDGDGFSVFEDILADDCNDNDYNINPGATEVPYNDFDENCNGMDDDDDLDQDGFGIADDCNDADPAINSAAAEIPYNGIDENCNDNADDDDLDQDGFLLIDDCDDTDATINPGAQEIPYNGIDENCSGMTDDDDVDTDGYGIAEDCNDNDLSIYPGATEVKHDGTDQDCNGYDLTIDIISAAYNVKDSLLTVKATSAWGETANLEVLGYWPMNWKESQMNWKYDFEGANNPGTVSVVGFEGSETADVTIELK